jgi:hypothetical protein
MGIADHLLVSKRERGPSRFWFGSAGLGLLLGVRIGLRLLERQDTSNAGRPLGAL